MKTKFLYELVLQIWLILLKHICYLGFLSVQTHEGKICLAYNSVTSVIIVRFIPEWIHDYLVGKLLFVTICSNYLALAFQVLPGVLLPLDPRLSQHLSSTISTVRVKGACRMDPHLLHRHHPGNLFSPLLYKFIEAVDRTHYNTPDTSTETVKIWCFPNRSDM